jgi:hypothetical protein
MANDRGTIQRGPSAGPGDQAPWPEVTGPAGRRLPSAPRERKPALAALALLLIVGGALGAAYLVLQSGKRVAAIEIAQQVGAGQQIPLSAMRQVQVAADTGIRYVPWADAAQVARFFAATTIPPGTLLSSAMVVQASAVTNGKDVLGLALKDGQWPAGLAVGDHVAIVAVSQSNASGCPGTGGQVLAGNASVLSVASASSASLAGASGNGATDVTVALNPGSAGAVACNASAGNVAVVVLPAGGQAPPVNPPGSTPKGGAAGATGGQSPGAGTGHG